MSTLPFQCSALPLSLVGVQAAAASLGVDVATIWTILSVETPGCGFLSDRRPQILYERHVFHSLTGGKWDLTSPNISNPQPGGYGSGGAAQYARLAQAVALDQDSALQSTSWGLGQVLGKNYLKVGFANVNQMVVAMCASEDLQIATVSEFIIANGLEKTLRALDWVSYARGYNGADYAKNNYDIRLANYYVGFQGGTNVPDLTIRAAQLYLLFLGFNPQGIDGLLGNNTLTALHNFQNANGLPLTTGIDAGVVSELAAAFPPGVNMSLT